LKLPDPAQEIVDSELQRLTGDANFDLHPERRIGLYCALGPACPQKGYRLKSPYKPTIADRVRTRIALVTAQKVLPLWQAACRETDANFADETGREAEEERKREEENYANQRAHKHIAEISVYDVPRAVRPAHIMEMADIAFRGRADHYDALVYEANEWWQIYGRPEGMERECFIKEAAQEALYEALGWYDYSNERELAIRHPYVPGGFALLAFAGIFDQERFRFDCEKRREFWRWWLGEAIPRAWSSEK
jgi:hypothetical protein